MKQLPKGPFGQTKSINIGTFELIRFEMNIEEMTLTYDAIQEKTALIEV